ncbi:MAG: hypothetical protein KBT68_07845 [bacterium]|nr:hypothetical protein [Candidatus Colisoma equi]
MREKDYATAIRARIEKAKRGSIFVMSDFADLAPNNAANRVVTRLVGESLLRVVIRGIYQKPIFSKFLNDWEEPAVNDVAQAIARKNGWRINPDGDTALNMLGLTTQVPSNWCYVSDGPYKTYVYGTGKIVFKHSSNRLMGNLSRDAALFVQALKALGEDHVDGEVLKRIEKRFTVAQLNEIEKGTRSAPDWIHAKAIAVKVLGRA